MAVQYSIEPLTTINAVFLGDAPVYNYLENGQKEIDQKSVYIKFATQMVQTIGANQEILPLDKVLNLCGDDRQSSLQCKIPIEEFLKIKANLRQKGQGVLTYIPKAVAGKFYPKFVSWTAKDAQVQQPQAQMLK